MALSLETAGTRFVCAGTEHVKNGLGVSHAKARVRQAGAEARGGEDGKGEERRRGGSAAEARRGEGRTPAGRQRYKGAERRRRERGRRRRDASVTKSVTVKNPAPRALTRRAKVFRAYGAGWGRVLIPRPDGLG